MLGNYFCNCVQYNGTQLNACITYNDTYSNKNRQIQKVMPTKAVAWSI